MIRRSWTSYKIHPTIAFAMMSCVWLLSFESAWAQHQEPADKPSWISSGVHPGYPAPRYVQGVGQAKASGDPVMDRQAADQNAFAEIIQQITAEVSSVISVEKVASRESKTETVFENASAETKVRSSLSVNGLTITERYYDAHENVYYSFGVVDRIAASDSDLQKLRRFRTDWQTYLKSAEEYRLQGKILQAILSLREAYREASQYRAILPSYQLMAGPRVFGSEMSNQQPEPSPALVLEMFSAVLASLHLQIDKGNEQAYIFNAPLPEPLVVRMTYGAKTSLPAEGLAIEFRFRSGQGDISPATTKTDSQGRAIVSVANIESSSDNEYTVAATVDFAELMDISPYRSDWNSRIPLTPPSILFALKQKKAPSTQVAVLVAEKSQHQGKSLLMRDALASRLSQSGFKAVSSTSLDKTVSSDGALLKWEKLHKLMPLKVDVVILGEITSISVSQNMGVVVCRLSGAISALDAHSGKVLSVRSMEAIPGFGTTENNARDDAYKNAGSEMAEALVNDLLNMQKTEGR